MAQAIIGLIGVTVGAIVTGGVSLFLEWRRDRVAARGGARLLQADLRDSAAKIEEAVETGQRWPGKLPLRTDRWFELQALMARRLRRYEWFAV